MRYLGGKHRIAKEICAIIQGRLRGRYFVEPFCGAINITALINGPRLASDASPYLFSLYKALRAGWMPPCAVSEAEYELLKEKLDPENPLTAFAGYGCSFSGKFFGGYARGVLRNYAMNARNSLLRKWQCVATLTTFGLCSYERLCPDRRCLVYCDPPYAGTTGYSSTGAFDSAHFWRVVKEWAAAGVEVLVSEYSAPAEFTSIWSKTVRADMQQEQHTRTEHLFMWRDSDVFCAPSGQINPIYRDPSADF